MATQRSHYKLNEELITRAAQLAALGWSQKSIAEACGVHHDTLGSWLASGVTEDGTDEECRLYRAIHEASVVGEAALVKKIADGDTRDAQWLLTHSPRWRNTWSDGAALRRELGSVLTTVVQVVQQSDLTPEQQDHLLLRMQAAGLGAPAN
jgi:hypothetical protein